MNEPGYVLVGDAVGVRMTPLACPELTDLLLMLLEKSEGFGAYDILCFYLGSPVFLKPGLIHCTLLYLKTPFRLTNYHEFFL